MKNSSRLLSLTFALLLVFLLCACGNAGQADTADSVDVHKLAADIVATGAFTDVQTDNTNGQALSVYGLEDDSVSDYSVYFSSMATPEEVAIFKISSPEQASAVTDACKARQSSQVQSYESYAPDQVEKLNNAMIGTSGDLVYYIVSKDNDTVKNVLQENGLQ